MFRCVCDCGKGNLKCGVGAGQCAPFENFVTLLKLKKKVQMCLTIFYSLTRLHLVFLFLKIQLRGRVKTWWLVNLLYQHFLNGPSF